MYTRSFTCVQDDNTSTIFRKSILFGYKNEEGFARTCNRIQVRANCFSNLLVCVYKSRIFCKQITAFYVLRTKTNQNRTVSVPKTYGFGSENVRFWDGNHKREIAANRLLIIRKGKRSQPEADYTVCGMYLGNQTQRRKANRCHSLALFALSKNKNLCVFASLCL